MSTPTRPAGAPAPGTFGTAETFGTFLRWGTMGTKRRSFLPLETFLSFFSFLPFLPLETFLSFFSFLPLESFQSFLTFLSFHAGKTFLSFLSFQACLAPLRHSPLARPVPPLPHAGEAALSVTVRSRVLCHLSRTRERQPSPSQSRSRVLCHLSRTRERLT